MLVNERRWLMGSPTFLTVNGQVLSASDGGGLSLIGVGEEDGVDNLGEWRATVMVYGPAIDTSETANRMETVFKYYKHLPNVYLFGQVNKLRCISQISKYFTTISNFLVRPIESDTMP